MGGLSEAELTSRIVERMQGELPAGATILTELGGVVGRPDITVLGPSQIEGPVAEKALGPLLSLPSIAQIVAALDEHGSTVDDLMARFEFSRPHLRRQLRLGVEAGLFLRYGDLVLPTMRLDTGSMRIVSYEVKLSDWRRALHQCVGYRMYSHEVRLIMPTRRVQNALKGESIIRNCGFGLMATESDGTLETVIEPADDGPSAPRYYLQALGHALKRLHGDDD